jgi:hypothetical protein
VLATPPTSRPVRYVVRAGAPLDLERVGVAVDDPAAALGEGDFVVDTAAPGLHGAGHPFLAKLGTDEARAVIEYLKTL